MLAQQQQHHHHRPRNKQAKLTKRQNARMQLAAALIEADNDDLERKRSEAMSSQQQDDQDSFGPRPRPPPPPQLRLASQSVLFAPWRQDNTDVAEDDLRDTHSVAASSSALKHTPSRVRSIQRPQSRDFLGVTLPGEREPQSSSSRNAPHSRTSSLLSTAALSQQHSTRRDSHNRRLSTTSRLSRATSRPATPLSAASRSRAVSLLSNADDNETVSQDAQSRLGEWGMDKFLSTEARDEIARDRHRQRAQSAAGFNNTHTRKDSQAGSVHSLNDVPDAPIDNVRHRATSDIVSVARPTKGTNLELLARIKLYRERQENLPPDQWGERVLSTADSSGLSRAPTPTKATPTEPPTREQFAFPTTDQPQPPQPTTGLQLALGSPIQTPDAEHATRQGSVPSHQATTLTASVDLNRRESSKGYFGESWSDAGSMWSHGGGGGSNSAPDTLNVTRGRNFSTTKPSSAIGHLDPTAEEDTVPDSAIDDDDGDDEEDMPMGMAGVGSYLRSHSRKNSMLDQSPLPTFARIEQQEDPSTTMRASRDTSPSAEHRPLRPSPLAHQPATTHANAMRGRSQPGPGNFEATAALQGDLYAALALGSSPYPGSTFFATGRHSPGPGAFHHSPTFDQLPLASPYMGAGFGLAPHNRLSQLPPSASAMSFPPAPAAPAASSPPSPELGSTMPTTPTMASLAMPGAGMTTRQLQALARHSQFPDSYGIITPFLMEEAEHEEKHRRQREQARAAGLMLTDSASENDDKASLASLPKDGWVPEPQRGLFSRALRPVGGLLGATPAVDKLKADLAKLEPDLSSARWGQNKRRYSTGAFKPFGAKRHKDEASAAPSIREPDLGATGHEPEVEESLQMQASDAVTERVDLDLVGHENTPIVDITEPAEPDIDDDYVSPPRKGPLKPRGVDARLPETLIMPEFLEGSAQQPRTRLTELETDSVEAGHGQRQSGLYVPEGFVLHDGKSLPPIQKVTTTGGKTRLSFVFPAAAPDGIGRRAKMPSTALFRNQLVQHEEEQEGWGWEKSTAPVLHDSDDEAGAEPVKLSKKQMQRAKKTATKEAKIRYKRKRARAVRRKMRAQAQAQGKSNAELGVPDESPNEDLSLTEDSVGYTSDEDWDSDDNKRWVDDQKPVGKLFGKSLMDVAEERQAQRQANRRYYGQLEVAEQEAFERASALQGGDAQSVMAPSEAGGRTFRDNPLGYNDTRERMQAAFGVDRNLARELDEKRKRDAQAAEEAELRRLAQEEYEREEAERKRRKEEKRNARRIFLKKKTQKQQLGGDPDSQNASESASFKGPQDLASASTSQVDIAAIENAHLAAQGDTIPDSPPIQRAPLEAPRLDLGLSDDGGHANGRKDRKGTAAAQWFAASSGSSSDSESDSEDEASRRKRAMQRARLSRSLGGPGMGRLDLAGTALARGASDESSSEDEVPLSQLKRRPLTQVATNKKLPKAFGDSSDDDDEGRMTLDQIKRRSLLARGGTSYSVPLSSNLAAVAASDSDEEMPLTQLRAKQNKARQSIGTTLDLTYSHTGSHGKVSVPDSIATPDEEDSDEDEPIGMRLDADALAALKKHGRGEEEDSDEDQPIALRHGVDVLAAIKAQHAAAHGARCACGRLK